MYKFPLHLADFYKTGHHHQYPDKTQSVYSNFTPRTSRVPQIQSVVTFGIQSFVKEYLIKEFTENFFQRPKAQVVAEFSRRMNTSLGPNNIGTAHLEALYDLGYLPIKLKALPEGTVSPIGIPVLTITNTKPEFYWLTNFLETLLSVSLWHPMTSATIAFEYRKLLTNYAKQTSDMLDFVPWQGHDFSMRGQTSVESAMASGAAHLLSFTGTDTIPAIDFLEEYYNANSDKKLIGGSVPATEHSVMSLGGNETEYNTFKRLITQVYPSGIVSIVSDTWDYWKVLAETVPSLKTEIMARDGKVVIRPDSGDPVKILCGDLNAVKGTIQYTGTVEYLYNTFGGTVNSKGYKQLDSHIGVIYGDSITLERAEEICKQLKEKGFSSTNCVFGIGSYTYQHVTRDTFGFAMKATHGTIDGKSVDIYKDPITDNGTKKSAKGLLRVNNDLTLSQQVSVVQENEGLLEVVFNDGKLVKEESLANIRTRLLSHL